MHWGIAWFIGEGRLSPRQECHMQIFIPQGGAIVDCSWGFDVILPKGFFFLLRTLCFLGEVWDVEVFENKLEATR